MTIAAYGQFTARGIARLAAHRAKAIEAECRAVQPEPAPVAVPVAKREPVTSEPEKIVSLIPSQARQLMRKHLMPHWVQSIVMAGAELHRVSPAAIVGRSRRRVIVAACNEVWYQIKLTASPVTGEIPSYPTIGKWFGRDHSSVIYGVARHAYENGLPSPSRVDPERLITRKKEHALAWARKLRGEA